MDRATIQTVYNEIDKKIGQIENSRSLVSSESGQLLSCAQSALKGLKKQLENMEQKSIQDEIDAHESHHQLENEINSYYDEGTL